MGLAYAGRPAVVAQCTVPALRFVGALIGLAALLPSACPAQPEMSDFNPEAELRRLTELPEGFTKVQRYYYLGELTSTAGRPEVAREAYLQAMVTYENLSGNHRTLATTYAAQAGLGLAGLTHLQLRETPLRWESYPGDSAKRWDLLAQAREQYYRVTTLGYARATFEAVYLRAHLLEEWDTGGIDTLAERHDDIFPITRGIRHLHAAVEMNEQAEREYRRVIVLADSLGLNDGTGDDDVSEWTGAARERLAELGSARRYLVAREEALHAIYAERQSATWAERATPLLWQRCQELAMRDAGVADPFFDYYIQTKLVDNAYRPFMFGPNGFYTSHRRAVDSARTARSERWMNDRLAWQRWQDWVDSDVSRRLAREGLAQTGRVFGSLDTMAGKLSAVVDSLPEEVRLTLMRLPPPPEIRMPNIPDWGGRDPRMFGREDQVEAVNEYRRYQEQIEEVEARIETYRATVLEFGGRVADLASAEFPPELVRYGERRNGLRVVEILLLDTLSAMALDQVDRALEQSRAAAVWMPPGPRAAASQQAIDDFVGAVAGDLRLISVRARSEAERRRREADRLGRRPPALDLNGLADQLEEFARLMEATADRLSTAASGT